MTEYVQKDYFSLDLVSELWKKLNGFHKDCSPVFAPAYAKKGFDDRKKELLKKAEGGKTALFLALQDGVPVGYCAVSIDSEGAGEIDSLFVEKDYRKMKMGDQLMRSSLDWLHGNAASKITIVVYAGNEKVLSFYERYGFVPRHIVLEQPPAHS